MVRTRGNYPDPEGSNPVTVYYVRIYFFVQCAAKYKILRNILSLYSVANAMPNTTYYWNVVHFGTTCLIQTLMVLIPLHPNLLSSFIHVLCTLYDSLYLCDPRNRSVASQPSQTRCELIRYMMLKNCCGYSNFSIN